MKHCNHCGEVLELGVNFTEGQVKNHNYSCVTCRRAQSMVSRSKSRAKNAGLEHDITIDDIIIPKLCPLLDIELESIRFTDRNNTVSDATPTLDRIDNTKGYIKGNVWVVSMLANRIMTSATPEQVIQVGKRFKKKLESINDKQLDLLSEAS